MRFLLLLLLIFLSAGCVSKINKPAAVDLSPKNLNYNNMRISSSVFAANSPVPAKYTCDGANINPPLEFSDVPAEAKSLVLIMDDPDAVKPVGHVWDHWLIWNMPPTVTGIEENSQPVGNIGLNSAGRKGYGGPCPPDGEHRYFFKLYALDTELNLPDQAIKTDMEKAMAGHILAQAELIGRYNRRP